jgi:Flp pilus assembly protein TadG
MAASAMRATAVQRGRGDRAVALVELAILLPFLAILVCGTVDFGRYYQAWNATKNAAREGALYAERFPMRQQRTAVCAFPDNITDKATQEIAENSSDPTFTVVITPSVPGGCVQAKGDGTDLIGPGDTVTVTVSRHVELITPIMSAIIGDVDITAKVESTVQG